MKRIYIKDLKEYTGKEVTIAGWVDVRRDQGKMIFLDIRDMSGIVQCVILPKSEALEVGKGLRSEWVIEVGGLVNKRPEKNANAGIMNGDIEIEIRSLRVLNQAETPPFDLSTNGLEIGEEHRL